MVSAQGIDYSSGMSQAAHAVPPQRCPMRQQVRTTITVEFDDKALQVDVDEALANALKNLQPMLLLVPAIKGKSTRGVQVCFKLKDIERT